MMEKWEPVPEFDGYYEVSDLGRIRSVDRITPSGRFYKSRIMTLTEGTAGYLRVRFCKDNNPSTWLVHRLVLRAFVGEPEDGQETRHLNGNPKDNRLENLAWGSSGENHADTVRHNNHPSQKKTHCPRGHLLEIPNLVKSSKARRCLVCYRAWHWAKYNGLQDDAIISSRANDQYEKLMEG